MESDGGCPANLNVEQTQDISDIYGSLPVVAPFSSDINIVSKSDIVDSLLDCVKQDENSSVDCNSEVFNCALENRCEPLGKNVIPGSPTNISKSKLVNQRDDSKEKQIFEPISETELPLERNDGSSVLSEGKLTCLFCNANSGCVCGKSNYDVQDKEGNLISHAENISEENICDDKNETESHLEEQLKSLKLECENLKEILCSDNNANKETISLNSADGEINEMNDISSDRKYELKHNEDCQLESELECEDRKIGCDSSVEGYFHNVSDLSVHLNSPVLKRSLLSPETLRTDCRSLFSESNTILEENVSNEDNKYQSLRDSLDMVKDKLFLVGKLEGSPCILSKSSHPFDITLTEKHEDDEYLEDTLKNLLSPSPVITRKRKVNIGIKGPYRDRRVSFPKDDTSLITSYLEPVNPWCKMCDVTTDEIATAYSESCRRHKTHPLQLILQQIAALPLCIGGRIECLNLRDQRLDANQCECLEEIFSRVQFKTLIFENCSLDDDSATPLFDMIEFYHSATHINISCNTKISQRGWQACARMLKRTESIEILDAHSTHLSEQNMPILAKALKLGNHLRILHLENCSLTGRPIVILTGALRLNGTLTDLFLADNRLGANDCIQIGNLIRSNKVLRLLDLRYNNIQDTGCCHICEAVVEQQTTLDKEGGLTALVLWHNYITIQAIPYISSVLLGSHTIEILNLGRNNLSTEGIIQLKNSLIRNRCVKQLGLQTTRIRDEGAVALAEYIADNFIIERIDLRENDIYVAGLMALSQSLRINKSLIQIDIDNNMKLERSRELKKQHEKLQLEIKEFCQQNQAELHKKILSKSKEEDKNKPTSELNISRKISLSCGDPTIPTSFTKEKSELAVSSLEPKKYRSPSPSPTVSPCPSPSLSPSPSPVPSPSKSRFEVLRVIECPSSPIGIHSKGNEPNIFSTSAPASFAMPMSSGLSCSLPTLVQPLKPNRFSREGGRFTVTRVKEEPISFKSCLPATRAMSSPSLIVPEKTEDVSDCSANVESLTHPEITEDKNTYNSSPAAVNSNANENLPRAPLALMETGSFDSDSEDITQSSDSTHSDEIKIAAEETTPAVSAWQVDKEKKENYGK